jgi:glycosyltransferase involved in cell wall biosynthesis
MNKKISVIIPNYNYARFLQRRIDCVVNQTIKPAEIIFLDDCSTDNSLEVAEEILSKADIPYRITPNEVNQGVFKQWLKGIELAQYDYFWIAEADDYCELNFLEVLLPAFDNQDVVISYCKSNFVDVNGNTICDENDYKKKRFETLHWDSNYINNQQDEIENYLSVINTIPNASAVVFSKQRINSLNLEIVRDYNKAGDWLFYLTSLGAFVDNKISYDISLLNYYVRHENSAYISNYQKPELFKELLQIYELVLQNYDLTFSTKELIFNQIYELLLWYDFDFSNESILNNLLVTLGQFSIIKELKCEYHRLTDRINSLTCRLHDAEFKFHETESSLLLAESKLYEAEQSLHNVLTSKSWKITKPLRKFFKLISGG